MSKVSGTVKWFSNRKGFGFITPTSANSPTEDAIFVHQTSIFSDGDYRTLAEGAEVEFDIETEASGKLKAINVTSPGGESIKPPKRDRTRKPRPPKTEETTNGENGHDTTVEANENSAPNKERNGRKKKPANKKTTAAPVAPSATTEPTTTKPPRDPPFHDALTDDVKASIAAKGVDLGRKMTIDIALGGARIKLGQGGYAGLADARGMVGEGTYACDPSGNVTFLWERCILFSNGAWTPTTTESLLKSLSLPKDPIMPVGPEETAATLWGADKSDAKEALAENGFKMKNIVLTRPPGYSGGPRRSRPRNRK